MKRNRISAIFELCEKAEPTHEAASAFVVCPVALLSAMTREQQQAFHALYQLAYEMAQGKTSTEIDRFQRLLDGVDIKDSEFDA